ncbi:hypothetical protein NL475_27075, partial [Klebsiella pneumoniae]|nr:hypothetical protein [Klebsiella pneumoniae]
VLVLTANALVLPDGARGQPPQNEHGEPLSNTPPQPVTVPLAAIRSVATVGAPGRRALEIGHDLSADKLRIEQNMMRP